MPYCPDHKHDECVPRRVSWILGFQSWRQLCHLASGKTDLELETFKSSKTNRDFLVSVHVIEIIRVTVLAKGSFTEWYHYPWFWPFSRKVDQKVFFVSVLGVNGVEEAFDSREKETRWYFNHVLDIVVFTLYSRLNALTVRREKRTQQGLRTYTKNDNFYVLVSWLMLI